MVYNGDYILESMDAFRQQFEKDYERAQYRIEVDGFFREPPVKEVCQFMSKSGDPDYQDFMIRHCILDRAITIYLDDEKIGSIRLNNIDDDWSVFQILTDHPMAYLAMNNTVMAFLSKKFTLPRKKGTGKAVAGQAKQK